MILKNAKNGFTLAEAMIALSLVGILASLSIPTIGSSLQQRARLSEFRAAYSMLESALKSAYLDKGAIYECYLVDPDNVNDYGYVYGNNTANSISACGQLEHAMATNLGYIRACTGDDLHAEGCLPVHYAGFGDIFNSKRAYVLANGMILIPARSMGIAAFAIDINGRKAPNKWGMDLFPLSVVATRTEYVSSLNTSVARSVSIMPPPKAIASDDALAVTGSAKTTAQMFSEISGDF